MHLIIKQAHLLIRSRLLIHYAPHLFLIKAIETMNTDMKLIKL